MEYWMNQRWSGRWCVALACLLLLGGCKKKQPKKQNASSCVTRAVPALLYELEKQPLLKRRVFLRRGLNQRCPGNSLLLKHLRSAFLGGKNMYEDAHSYKELKAELRRVETKPQMMKLRLAYRRLRKLSCPTLSLKEYIFLVENLSREQKLDTMFDSCPIAAKFLPRMEWRAAYHLTEFVNTLALYELLRELGVKNKHALQFARILGTERTHHRRFALVPSHAPLRRQAMTLDTIELYRTQIRVNRIKALDLTKAGVAPSSLVDDVRKNPRLLMPLFEALQRNRANLHKEWKDTREKYRYLHHKKKLQAQRKRFIKHLQTKLGALEIFLHHETPFQTLYDVLHTCKQAGWPKTYVVVGQERIPFYGAARWFPLKFFRDWDALAKKAFPKRLTVLSLHSESAVLRYVLRAKQTVEFGGRSTQYLTYKPEKTLSQWSTKSDAQDAQFRAKLNLWVRKNKASHVALEISPKLPYRRLQQALEALRNRAGILPVFALSVGK